MPGLPLRLPAAVPAIAALALLATAPSPGVAQRECDLLRNNYVNRRQVADGSAILYVSGPLLLRCRDGSVIRADSAAIFEASGFTQLFDNVLFEDPERGLTADRANYFDRDGRLNAWGGVRLTDKVNRSVITGDSLIYLQANRFRTQDQLTVYGGRPHATLHPRRRGQPVPDTVPAAAPGDSAAPGPGEAPGDTALPPLPERVALPAVDTAASPYEVDARRIVLEGNRFFRAEGDVEIRRDSLDAFGDTVRYDQEEGRLRIRRDARIETDRFDLTGEEITLIAPGDELEEIVAREEALLLGDALRLSAPRIRLFVTGDQLDRLVAVQDGAGTGGPSEGRPGMRTPGEPAPAPPTPAGQDEEAAPDSAVSPVRPEAVAEDFQLEADSIEVIAPAQRLDRVVAVGRARGESLRRDSLVTEETPGVLRGDWIEGDTIVATFRPAGPTTDTTGAAPVALADSTGAVPGATDTSRAVPEAADTPGDSARYVLDRLVARGSARSLYRMERAAGGSPPDTAATPSGRLAVNYVVGDSITIVLRDGEVDRMEVAGQTRGVYLQPTAPRGPPRPADEVGGPPP